MSSNPILKLDYQEDEAVSAQRMWLRERNSVKIGVAAAILIVLGAVAQEVWSWYESKVIPVTWWMPVLWLIGFATVFGIAYLQNPVSSFRSNSWWHNKLELHLSSEWFRITPEGQSEGLEIEWGRIRRVVENDKVYLLFWGSEQEFSIFPKRVLQAQDGFVRDVLKQRANVVWKFQK